MLTSISHLPVNWVSGMKITQKHFIETDNAFIDGLRDSRMLALNRFYYGILPVNETNENNFQVEINTNGESLSVNLTNCRAVTSNGNRIEIINQHFSKHTNVNEMVNYLNLDSQPYEIYVIIHTNPFDRAPIGEPSKEEIPTRQPHAQPVYKIDFVLPANFSLNQSTYRSSLVIGKVRLMNRNFSKDNDYFPPCMAISSHSKLYEVYNDSLKKKVKMIMSDSLEIIRTVRTYKRLLHSVFAGGIMYVAEHTNQFLIPNITRIDLYDKDITPIDSLSFFIEFLNLHFYLISTLGDDEKNKITAEINKMPNHHRYSPQKYAELTRVPYNHDDIGPVVKKLSDHLEVLTEVFRFYVKVINDISTYEERELRSDTHHYTGQPINQQNNNNNSSGGLGWNF
ncbi:hypothetical protein [Emticicia sp. 17c]|uniref:hypothetical protein n=1 Tax=Emticicia sp. 17c TaxID=3127704 RepID=UPI00301C5A68